MLFTNCTSSMSFSCEAFFFYLPCRCRYIFVDLTSFLVRVSCVCCYPEFLRQSDHGSFHPQVLHTCMFLQVFAAWRRKHRWFHLVLVSLTKSVPFIYFICLSCTKLFHCLNYCVNYLLILGILKFQPIKHTECIRAHTC